MQGLIIKPTNDGMDIYDIYYAAMSMTDTAARDEYVRAHCGDDEQLAATIFEMLDARDRADELFEGDLRGMLVRDREHDSIPGEMLGRIGQFRLDRLVGRGSMGNVFLAYDEVRDRPVALKFPHIETVGRPELLRYFIREAKIATQLDHPNLVKVYQVDAWRETCYIVSQWCHGGDLARWLIAHPGPQDPRESASLVREICHAVAYCHEQNVVHLDIKPANIILEFRDASANEAASASGRASLEDKDASLDGKSLALASLRPMLTDFGIARVVGDGLTQSSSFVLGTPMYMAPEQAESRRDQIGSATDVFAIGAVLYELVYGKRAFQASSTLQMLDRVRHVDSLAYPATKHLPRDLVTIIGRCLRYDASERYANAKELANDLDRFLRGERIHARPVTPMRRVIRWCSRPERLWDIVINTLVVQTLLSLWVLMGILFAETALSGDELWRGRSDMAITIYGIAVPIMAMAYLSYRGHVWSVYIGMAIAFVGQVIVPIAALVGVVDLMQSLYEHQPFFKRTNLSLILFCGLLQTCVFGIAALALSKRPRLQKS